MRRVGCVCFYCEMRGLGPLGPRAGRIVHFSIELSDGGRTSDVELPHFI